MFHYLNRFFIIFFLNLTLSIPIYANLIEQKKASFSIQSERIHRGEVHFYYNIFTKDRLAQRYPRISQMDSILLGQNPSDRLEVSKTVYMINKPVGFFDDKELMNEKYISHMWGKKEVKKINNNSIKIIQTPPLELRAYFDSDDISTVQSYKVSRSISSAKEMDVISKSAPVIMVNEIIDLKTKTGDEISVTSFIPVKEEKTMIVTYGIKRLNKKFPDKTSMKIQFTEKLKKIINLQESYTPAP